MYSPKKESTNYTSRIYWMELAKEINGRIPFYGIKHRDYVAERPRMQEDLLNKLRDEPKDKAKTNYNPKNIKSLIEYSNPIYLN